MKNLYTRQVENLKRRLGQKWVSRWTENPKGWSRKKLGIKAYDYVLIGSLTASFIFKVKVQMVQINSTHFLPTARDEMLEDIGAIAKLEPN